MTIAIDNSPNFDRMEAYLFNLLTAEERTLFEQQVANDPSFADELAQHRLEHTAILALHEQDLRSTISSWQQPQQTEKATPVRRLSIWRYAAAATVLLVVSFVSWQLLRDPSVSGLDTSKLLFKETLAQTETSRSKSSTNEATVWQNIEKAEAAADFKTALAELDKLDATTVAQSPDRIQLMRGIFLYQANDYPKAAAVFKQLTTSGVSTNAIQKAEWGLVLSYLAMDKNSDAFKTALKTIIDKPQHPFYEKAVKLSH